MTYAKPAIIAYRAAIAEASRHTPGGVLFHRESHAIARTVAKDHGCTPDDLIRWNDMAEGEI